MQKQEKEILPHHRFGRFWQPGTIRTRLLVAFISVVLLTGLVIAAVSAYFNFQNAQEQIFDQLESVAALKESQVDTWIDDLQNELDSVLFEQSRFSLATSLLLASDKLSPAVREDAYGNLRDDFKRLIDRTGRFEEIFLMNRQGQTVLSTDPTQEGKIQDNQTYFKEGLQGAYVQPPRYFPSLGRVLVIFTQPVIDTDGQVLGVLAGRASLEVLSKIMIERAGLGETGETYLVASNQTLLTESKFQGFNSGETYVRSEGANLALQDKTSGTGLYKGYRNISVYGVYRWIPQLQVALLAEQDQTEALNPTYTTLTISGAVSVFAILIAVVVGLFITRSIATPLANLAATARQIAAGDFQLTAPITRKDEIGDLAQAFNTMTAQLRGLIDSLEERVRGRTRALETGAEISRQLTAILDLDELLNYVVNRVQSEFKLYHTHIYLLDEPGENLVMVAGYGEVGRQLKERGHHLPAGYGIVGTVASTNEHFLSNNVNEVLNFVRNQLLPHTNSELAVPLRKGEQVLGVLDVQSEQINRFTQEDVSLLQSIANQTAVAISNARLLTETQTALQEIERLNRRLTREGWQQIGAEIAASGYRYVAGSRRLIAPASDAWLPPMKQAALEKQLVKQTHQGNGDAAQAELAVPLMLRGEVIGVLGVKREENPDWAAEEVAAVEAVANQIALALENARLSKEQEKTIVQLKDVDRLKSEFLTSMSHELRTPLNSIIGFADVLLQGIDGELNDMALNDIQLIHNSGKHLLALINDILDLSKIEAGKMELVREPVLMNEITAAVLASSNSLVKDKPVRIITEVPETLPPVLADKLRLNQILLNLVSNAAKFTHEGKITVKAALEANKPKTMLISVADTGIGIPSDKLNSIFERFRQADAGTTRKYGGTGLGLAICKQLVEMHGGTLQVKSEEGLGSEFYFNIPLA
ncbi:MAG: GAF domain-containing protein [Anaerolineales bacterium]|nr:GAF domain-containing protein [Anaerolineales bacterium]